jgi:hypothetical protein
MVGIPVRMLERSAGGKLHEFSAVSAAHGSPNADMTTDKKDVAVKFVHKLLNLGALEPEPPEESIHVNASEGLSHRIHRSNSIQISTIFIQNLYD